MKIVGYGDKLSVEPGSAIEFMVSSEFESFDAALVRLIHGDTNPAGPGFKSEPVESELAGTYPGQYQPIRNGSYVRVPQRGELDFDASFTIQMWIRPTMPEKESQVLLSKLSPGGSGYALSLERGRLTLRVGPDLGGAVSLERPVESHTWYSVAAAYDAEAGEARLRLDPLAPTAAELGDTAVGPLKAEPAAGGDLLIAAAPLPGADKRAVGSFYNGKIDSPRLFDRALGEDEIARLGDGVTAVPEGLVAAWDFSADIPSSAITDTSVNGLHGRAINKPMRGATGWNWDGAETAWRHAPDQYGAIHFHDDDLDDAGWERSLRFEVPGDLPSGVYAAHLRAEGHEDYIPFVVRPKLARPTAKILFLMPVFSYLAYANDRLTDVGEELLGGPQADYPVTAQDSYIVENRLKSLYDVHTDGSGVCYSSRLRPIVNMRPKYDFPAVTDGQSAPHQFNADLHIVDWLHEGGYDLDVVTDEDLHLEGAELLAPYDVVLTGSHCEYWSIEMIRATQGYLGGGGRLMYLGGNGMYWVTQHDTENGNGIEIRRRGPAIRSWEPEPGEAHLSATGELGGLWRYRGESPHRWLGVGSAAMGLTEGRPYERQPDSSSERGSWVFEGIGDDEPIGDFPTLVTGDGAAGFEIDRADLALGTPRRTLVLATATGFSDFFYVNVEEIMLANPPGSAAENPLIRADLALLEYPADGAVFSTGSIAWSGALSYNGYDNTVSRVTRNVLERFLSPGSVLG